MGRSNKAVVRKNNSMRRRRPRGDEDYVIPKFDKTVQRVELRDLVIPDGKCYRNPRRPKDVFIQKANAEKALEQAQRQRRRMGSAYVEKRFYECNFGGVAHYHLTSRETFDENRGRASL